MNMVVGWRFIVEVMGLLLLIRCHSGLEHGTVPAVVAVRLLMIEGLGAVVVVVPAVRVQEAAAPVMVVSRVAVDVAV